MYPIGARQVEQAVAEMQRTLGPHVDADWRQPAGGLAWTCRQTAVHVAHDLLAYAGQLAGRPADRYLPLDLTVPDDATPGDVLQVVGACGGLLATIVDAAGPRARGWHWGPTDRTGFAALGVNEVLMHTHDIAAGLGVPWLPPAPLCVGVLARLFPDAPAGPPPLVLLWCTGRGVLTGRARRGSWSARAAVP